MKALLAIVTSLLLISAPVLAQSAPEDAGVKTGKPKHMTRRRARPDDEQGSLQVSIGSNVRITPTGEVVAPSKW